MFASITRIARTYRLSHFTKGTGAAVEPIDDSSPAPTDEGLSTVRLKPEPRKAKRQEPKRSTSLAPGLVRKKTTGEVGRVRSVDSKAGTATVLWLRQGQTSTVPIASVTRR